MSTKRKSKGKKGKKDKKVDPNKLNQVDRAFCELTITDLNQKLARLRAHLAGLDDTNLNLAEKLRELEEDRTDVAAHLSRTLAERENTIHDLEERLSEITKVRNTENLEAQEKIKDLEAKYKAMHDQLTSEIKLLNGKLNSLDEFRVQRDMLLSKFDDQEADLKEKERAHQELMHDMEQKAIVEKDALKKEVEVKLLQVSEDFTRSSEIRNAGYTRRLIRENIALQKEIDTLVLSQIKIQQKFFEQIERHKAMSEQYAALDQMKTQLIRNSQNKIAIIEKLTTNYEKLKTKYIQVLKYRKLYETLVKRDVCEHFTHNDMSKKLRLLANRIDTLKMDKGRLLSMHQKLELEVIHLREIIVQIKLAVASAIDAIGHTPRSQHSLHDKVSKAEEAEATALQQLRRKDLLSELMDIVSSHADRLPDTPTVASLSRSRTSLYRPGKIGLMHRTPSSLLEMFKKEARKVASAEMISPEYQLKQMDANIIPKARPFDRYSLIDVELGSTLYVSSSHENVEIVQDEEEPVAGEEGTSSDYDQSSYSSDTQSKAQPTKVPSEQKIVEPAIVSPKDATSLKSMGSSRDLSAPAEESSQNYEEEEEDENSINLFY